MSEPGAERARNTGEATRDQAGETFAEQLRRLMELKRHNNKPYSPAEVAKEMTQRGYKISKSYLYELLDGKSKPSHKTVQKFAEYFAVSLDYFSNSERGREIQAQYDLLAKITRKGVRDVAYRASDLSATKLANVLAFIDFQRSQPDEDHTSE